jgi:4-hydroxy-tetrahydrodipicolinate reductase|nr:4-hydroxy-tetrahydrodipicolinate reductase [Zhaonella formicivorans]
MVKKTKVVVTGAYGRVGREVVRAVLNTDDLELAGAVDLRGQGLDVGLVAGLDLQGITITDDLEGILQTKHPEVLIDFTTAEAVLKNSVMAINYGVSPVIGTTGLTTDQLDELHILCEKKQIGAVIAPNFAIGAILMMRFAKEAAKYFPHVEIIELHHEQKLDAPSGTALGTAQAILEERGELKQGNPHELEKIVGARGAQVQGIHLHSVRLPGLVAHQEVLFGGLGQTLTIRHDSLSRESFIPGILLAVRKVRQLRQVIIGLDSLI